MNLPIITELKMTCEASPTQWECKLENGQFAYIRYRHGKLSWGIGDTLEDAVTVSFDNERDGKSHWNDGSISYRRMANALEDIFDFETIDNAMQKYVIRVFNPAEIIKEVELTEAEKLEDLELSRWLHSLRGNKKYTELGFSSHSED